jgi:hypothetical protein
MPDEGWPTFIHYLEISVRQEPRKVGELLEFGEVNKKLIHNFHCLRNKSE